MKNKIKSINFIKSIMLLIILVTINLLSSCTSKSSQINSDAKTKILDSENQNITESPVTSVASENTSSVKTDNVNGVVDTNNNTEVTSQKAIGTPINEVPKENKQTVTTTIKPVVTTAPKQYAEATVPVSVQTQAPVQTPVPVQAPVKTEAPVSSSEWLSGYEHKPLRCNVQPNKLYWGTTSIDQMNAIAGELDYLFNDRTEFQNTDCTTVEFYYNRDIIKTSFSDIEAKRYKPLPDSLCQPTQENLGIWKGLCISLMTYYGFGGADAGKNDNAYIAYSTFIDPNFRQGANSNGDCGGRAEFVRSFLNYIGYETRLVAGTEYGGAHAGLQIRCGDTGAISTFLITKENITEYGAWE